MTDLNDDFTSATGSLVNWEYGRTSYYFEVLRDRPVGYWRLGETTGTAASDSISNGGDGLLINSPALGQPSLLISDVSGSMHFTTNQYITMGDYAHHSFPTNIFSIEFWAKFDDLLGTYSILGKRGAPWEYSVFTPSAGLITFIAWTTAGATIYSNPGLTVPDANSHHWVWTADGANSRVYLDGVIYNTTAKAAGNMSDTTSPLEIGRGGDGGGPYYMKGYIDEVALYPTVLTAPRILVHYQAGRKTYAAPTTDAVPTRLHYDLRNYYETFTIPLTMLDMQFWNVAHWQGMTMTQLLAGVAVDSALENWVATGGGGSTQVIGKQSAWRYHEGAVITVLAGQTYTLTSLRVDDILTNFGGTYYIDFVLRDLPAQTNIGHLDLANSFVDFSSDASGLFAAGVTDSIAFNASVNSLTAGGDVALRIARSSLTNANLANLRGVRLRLKGVASVTPPAPTVALGAAGTPAGTYVYAITYVTATGETLTGPASLRIIPVSQHVTVSWTAGPTGTTGYNVYRASVGAGLFPGAATLPGAGTFPGAAGDGIFRRLSAGTTVGSAATVSFDDNLSDAAIAGFPIAPLTDTGGSTVVKIETARLVASGYTADVLDLDTKRQSLTRSAPLAGTPEWLTDYPPIFLKSNAKPKHVTQVFRFNSGTLPTAPTYSALSLIARYDITTGKHTLVRLKWNSAATTITTSDNGLQAGTTSAAALTANTNYLLKVQVVGTSATATIYNSSGIFYGSVVMTHTAPVTTRQGYVGLWFQPYNYDSTVEYCQNQGALYAQFESSAFPSVKPVIGATLNPKASAKLDIITAQPQTYVASGDGGTSLSTLVGNPPPSTLVARTGLQWLGGRETSTLLSLGDTSQVTITGDIFPASLSIRGQYRVVLQDSHGSVGCICIIPNLLPRQWNHFELPLNLGITPQAFKLFIHQTGYFDDTFYLEDLQALTNTMQWDASADAGVTWQPFLNAISEKYSAVHFGTRGTLLKIRGSATDPNAWVAGYELVPRYSYPGHVGWT